ncbi:MAG: hypothetical protein KAS32_31110 [Candidatus Peribacteraceae bacterium]|nr:hypothetical protein [Candidatus Peribacteraceae bacterium]
MYTSQQYINESLDKISMKKGQLIKVDGIPFELDDDTTVLGNKKNLSLTKLKTKSNDLTKQTADGHASDSTQLVLKGANVYKNIH